MEAWDGILLSEYIKGKKIEISDFLNISRKIAVCLNEIHNENVIHKDLNPSNILINPSNGQIKIFDFGKASLLRSEKLSGKMNGRIEGTIGYISPEQTGRINSSIDYRSDYYSMGVSFFEMLNGELPFYADNHIEYIHMHLTGEIKWKNPELEAHYVLKKIVNKLLEKDKDKRYQSIEGLISDLDKFQQIYSGKNNNINFILGQHDIPKKIEVSQKLYGKDNEINMIKKGFQLVKSGSSEIIFLSGNSGVGKSRIVNELYPYFIEKGAYYMTAKADQYQKDIPYKLIIESFRELFLRILMESQDKIDYFKGKILDKIGLNGQIIIDIIPEFEKKIGAQPEVEKLPAKESMNRFINVFYNLISAIASEDTPLVFFLDDMQWCDTATLSFVKTFLNSTITPYAYLICAYRDNEVEELSPLRLALDELETVRNISEIKVNPLTEDQLEYMIADSLKMEKNDVKTLSKIINKKTRGNPFFTIELFKSLDRLEFINFDLVEKKWKWDISGIESLEISDNVVGYLIEKIKNFPEGTQKILMLGACLGTRFNLRDIFELSDKSYNFSNYLIFALQEEIIKPVDTSYIHVYKLKEKDIDEIIKKKINFKFPHDKIQQAAYSMLNYKEKKEIHLKIARMLCSKEKDGKLLRIVYHYNNAISLLDDSKEKQKLVRLNLDAVRKSKNSVAFKSAYGYISYASQLLKGFVWEKENQDLLKTYFIEHATCAYLIGEYSEADSKMDELLNYLESSEEKAEIYAIKSLQYSTAGKMQEAIKNGITGIELLSEKLREKPNRAAIMMELLKIKLALRNKKVKELANMNEIQDDQKKLLIKILLEMAPSAYLTGNDNLFALITLKLVNYTLKYGDFDETASIYSMFGILNIAAFDDYETGIEFGKLSMAVKDKYSNLKTECRIYNGYSDFIMPWFNHWSDLTQFQKKGIDVGYQSGDYLYLSYIAHHIHTWNPKLNLIELCELKLDQIKIIKKTNYQDALDETNLFYGMCMNLRDLSDGFFSLNYESFNEEECLDRMRKRKFLTGITVYNIWKAEVYFIYNRYENAQKYIIEAEKTLGSVMGLPYIVRFNFLKFMVYALQTNISSKNLNMIKSIYNKKFKRWASINPKSFMHLKLIMEAEISRIKKKTFEYIFLYDEAILSARKNGWLRDEAMANELCAKHLLKENKNKLAVGYLEEAIKLFASWGAKRKVIELEKIYNNFCSNNKNFQSLPSKHTYYNSEFLDYNNLDIISLLKASQAISNEIDLDSLLKKIMAIAVENAGAKKGCYISVEENNLFVKSELTSESSFTNFENKPFIGYKNVPQGLINYVARTFEDVVYYDASSAKENLNDEYIQKNSIKSVLILSIKRKNQLRGILYFENNYAKGVFTKDRVTFLKALLGQINISLENANLYRTLKNQNEKLEFQVSERTKNLLTLNGKLADKNEKLREAYGKLEEIAQQDPLTKLLNRRSMLEKLEDAISKFKEYPDSIYVLIMDIDNFKLFNDTYGHDCGDFVLKSVSDKIRTSLRASDFLSRWGGEEFLALLPNSDRDKAYSVAERIRKSIADYEFLYNGFKLKITLTIGIGEYEREDSNISDVIGRADKALYLGKKSGKNKVV